MYVLCQPQGATEDDQKASCSCVVSVFFYKYTINTPADPPSYRPQSPTDQPITQMLAAATCEWADFIF